MNCNKFSVWIFSLKNFITPMLCIQNIVYKITAWLCHGWWYFSGIFLWKNENNTFVSLPHLRCVPSITISGEKNWNNFITKLNYNDNILIYECTIVLFLVCFEYYVNCGCLYSYEVRQFYDCIDYRDINWSFL